MTHAVPGVDMLTDLIVQIIAGLVVLAIAAWFTQRLRKAGSAHPGGLTAAGRWTEAEFETLLSNPNASDAELSRMIGTRTPGAIGVVREGIHAYHRGKDPGILNKMMKERLVSQSRPVRCPKCGAIV